MTSSRNHYEILGVPHTADLPTLKKAFHRLSKVLHPDTTLLPSNEAANQFRQVCEAYQLLSDPITRKLYDKNLKKEVLKTDAYGKQLNIKDNDKASIASLPNIGNRRPLSSGELFSLFLLCIALMISLLLGIGFALLDGRELQVSPSWLTSDQPIVNDVTNLSIDRNVASS